MTTPLFKFGLISDIQWADIPDGKSFHGTPRYYREALVSARRAVAAFKAEKVDLAIHLGDIIDFHNSHHDGHSETALQAAIECFDALEKPTIHCIGNHCLYNHTRDVLNSRLGINAHKEAVSLAHSQHSYFVYTPIVTQAENNNSSNSNSTPSTGYKFIVLDGYDVSYLGWPPGNPLHEKAVEILNAKNPNEDKNSNNGLKDLDRRFVKFGGGCSDAQLEWLKTELEKCRETENRAFICCHLCLHPETCAPTCLLWNFDQVQDILSEYSDVVVATLAGHAHRDGYYLDSTTGIHHRVCAGVLEAAPGTDCYGIVEVYNDRIEVKGKDSFESGVWKVKEGKRDVLAV
jgi:manganese-dependent ADP-ribose/CDP-alcohol diphosphatase